MLTPTEPKGKKENRCNCEWPARLYMAIRCEKLEEANEPVIASRVPLLQGLFVAHPVLAYFSSLSCSFFVLVIVIAIDSGGAASSQAELV